MIIRAISRLFHWDEFGTFDPPHPGDQAMTPTEKHVTPEMLLDAAGWCQSEDELRDTLRQSAEAVSAALAVEAGTILDAPENADAKAAFIEDGYTLTTSPASSGVEGEAVAEIVDMPDGTGRKPLWFNSMPPSGTRLYASPAPQTEGK